MYFSDIIYLAFLLILLFIIIYKGFKHKTENDVADNLGQMPTRRQPNRRQIQMTDRQGNIFTIADDVSNNPTPHRCTDFFYVEPSSEDAARIRAQLEKDDKDLPSYDEVMGLGGNRNAPTLPLTTSGTSTNTANLAVSNTSIATTDTTLTVPPYSEIDPAPITTGTVAATAASTGTAAPPTTVATTFILADESANVRTNTSSSITTTHTTPSTSHASTVPTVVIANSVSNTSV